MAVCSSGIAGKFDGLLNPVVRLALDLFFTEVQGTRQNSSCAFTTESLRKYEYAHFRKRKLARSNCDIQPPTGVRARRRLE